MKCNFYYMEFIEENMLPFIREGVPLEESNGIIYLNGLGKYRVFREIEEINLEDSIEERFANYKESIPWIGREEGIVYLYRAGIDENNLNLGKCSDNAKYLCIQAKKDDFISVLNGKIFFRDFAGDNQTSLIKFNEGTILHIEKEEGLIIVELVDGEFICR